MADKDKSLVGLIMKVGGGIVVLILGIILLSNMLTTVEADEIVVKQNFFDGQLQVWSSPGVHWQNFGRITRYKKSSQYWFSAHKAEGKEIDESIKVRFSDGGHGNVSGSLRYNLPTDPQKMIKLHSTYGSAVAIDHELVRQVVNKSVFMTGPLMSSRESYAEKRADLINFITDQVVNGVYRTQLEQAKTTDIISGQEKTVDFVKLKVGNGPNGIEREEISPIETFGMTAYNITINQIDYDPTVEEQIKNQQKSIMSIQQNMADARKAEQRAITVAKEGEAEAAKAKWEQEVSKAKAVTSAEQDKAVATLQATKDKEVAALALETAKLDAQKTITEAKASADAKKLAIQADNALQIRIDAYVEVNKNYAAALGSQRQTPDVIIGSGNGGSNASNLMDMFMVKTAKDLGVNPKP